MQYVKITLITPTGVDNDILIAMLTGAGYEGFEETGKELLAYITEPEFDEDKLKPVADASGRDYSIEVIPSQNWNALWESNFQPVIVNDFCTIRAHFHELQVTTTYDIVITPKMSFGTGHHATTQLMIMMMKDLQLEGKRVLDFGTGTGVLAILAEKLGANNILAIDNDTWCIENATENAMRNNCNKITVQAGSLEDVTINEVDVILANINRHILLQYMQQLYRSTKNDGMVLMSGLLSDDKEMIVSAAVKEGFSFIKIAELNGWIALLFKKHNE